MWLVLEQTPKIELLEGNTIIFFLQKLPSLSQNIDASSQLSISISGFWAGRVEPGPCLAIVSSRARRVESRLDPSLRCRDTLKIFFVENHTHIYRSCFPQTIFSKRGHEKKKFFLWPLFISKNCNFEMHYFHKMMYSWVHFSAKISGFYL